MRTRLISNFTLLFVAFAAFAVIMLAFPAMAFAQTAGPTIQSDKADYGPGDLVTLRGGNWQPGESVQIFVNDSDNHSWQRTVTVTAYEGGTIFDEFNLPESWVANYTVVATGELSGTATTTFTDSLSPAGASVNGGPSAALPNVAVAPGGTVPGRLVVNGSSATNETWGSTRYTIGSSTACVDHSNATVSSSTQAFKDFDMTAPTAAGTYNVTFIAYSDDACSVSAGTPFTLANAVTVNSNILFSEYFGSANTDSVPGWTDSDGTTEGRCKVNGPDGANFYARLRSGGPSGNDQCSITKTNISTAGRQNISLAFTWGRSGAPGSFAVQWKKSTDAAYSTLGNFVWTTSGTDSAKARSATLLLGGAANNTSIDIRFVGPSTEDTEARIDAVRVTQINTPPTATNDSVTTNEDTARTVNVLANDTDRDGDTLQITSVGTPSHGTATINNNGTPSNTADDYVDYNPAANYFGTDSFTYTISDGKGGTATGTVNVTVNSVNDNPTISDITGKQINEDTSTGAISFTVGDVETAAGSLQVSGSSSNQTLVPNNNISFGGSGANRTVTVTPAADKSGTATITVTVTDADNGTSNDTFLLTVLAGNDAPVAVADSDTTYEDTPVAIDVKANDTDGDGDSLSVVASSLSDPANGTVSLITSGTNAGKVLYTPDQDYNNTAATRDTFSYKVTDGQAASNAATVSVRVDPVNDAPSFQLPASPNQTVLEDSGAKSVTGFATSISPGPANEGSQAVDFLVSNDNTGLFSAQPAISSNGTLTFTPAADAFGTATVTVKAHDDGATANGGVDTSAAQTFTISVTAVNDAPIVSNSQGSQNAQYSDPIAAVTITATDIDTPVSSLMATSQFKKDSGSFAAGLPSGLSLALTSTSASDRTWTLSGTANNLAPGTYVVRVAVSDGDKTGYTDVTIVVTQENATAGFSGALFYAVPSGNATVTLSAVITDAADGSRGDITNAKVTFVNRDTGATLCGPLNVVPLTPGETTVGAASCNVSLGYGTGSNQYTVGIKVNGYYVSDNSAENTVVTVSQAVNGMITGGGYLVNSTPSSSGGQYAAEAGQKTNFGFNVKYNNSLTNLQGTINTIVRSGGKVYQIKGNAMSSLTRKPCPSGSATVSCPATATFNGKANIQDITNPLKPISVVGNASLQVTLTDKGEPGKADTIGIQLSNTNGSLLFSSKWVSPKTVEDVLGGGNLVVR
jgi:VCBS repeat-containing protein